MKSKPFLIVFFGGVLVLTGLSIYFSLTIDRARKAVEVSVSPDGRFKATRTTIVTGGAPHVCLEDIIVRLAVYPDEFQEKRNLYQVYDASCAADRTPPKMEWLSNVDLRITYAAMPTLLKDTDIGKTVHVTFVER